MSEALFGKRVLVTRAVGQNEELSQLIESKGAIPVEFPTIEIVPTQNPIPLVNAINNLTTYDWLVFTSINGVNQFWRQLVNQGKDATDLHEIRLAAIGPATARTLLKHNLHIERMPEKHVAEALAKIMDDVAGMKILIPTTDIARPTLAEALRAKGANVDQLVAYQTRPVEDRGDLPDLLPSVDVLTFTSSSTVRNFVNLLQVTELSDVAKNKTVSCIGPITTQTAIEMGLPVHITADKHTIPGLVEALDHYFQQERPIGLLN